jgi:NADPH-dependent 2,4-dienoyl-CoA reductase/sulfur reductase-like enzyme
MVGTRINDPAMAENIIQDHKADMIALGRPSIADPEWTIKAKKGLVEDINKCIFCNRCLAGVFPAYHHHIRCTVNASAYRERAYKIRPADIKKNVLIAGAGPAGMETARVAALRGHKVTLCDKSGQLGGQLLLAAKSPHKDEIAQFTAYLTHQIDKLDIDVMLNTEVTPELVKRMGPDVVIIATGAVPSVPDLPGIKNANVVTAWDVIDGKATIKGKIVIAGGGMVGCEVAELLALKNCDVTIVEMLDRIAADVEPTQRMFLMERFSDYKLDIVTGATIEGFSETGVKVKNADGTSNKIPADHVVLALGATPDNALAEQLEDELEEMYVIGDCRKPYRILEAVHDGAYIAREI